VPTRLRPGVINVFSPLKQIARYFEEVHIIPRALPRCIAQPTCTLFVHPSERLNSQGDGTVFRDSHGISHERARLAHPSARREIEGAFVQRTNQRRAAHQSVRERSSLIGGIVSAGLPPAMKMTATSGMSERGNGSPRSAPNASVFAAADDAMQNRP